MSLTLPAPAKINLFLRITGRRPDGYHELQTLFQLLDYSDTLTFSLPDPDDGVITVEPELPNTAREENLIYRAALTLQNATGCRQGAHLSLDKQIPMGGGLGGGSSDAATTLVGLNRLWKLGLSTDELATLGLRLGADVPVFVRGRSAWAEGVGERLTSLDIPTAWYLILVPECQVPTAAVFAHPQLTRHGHPLTIRAFLDQGAENACQAVVEKLYPEVKAARQWLEDAALNASGKAQMTGTGSCVFTRFDSPAQALSVLARKPPQWGGFVARGINQSPLYVT